MNADRNTKTNTVLGEIANIQMGQSPLSSTYNEIGEGLPFYQGITEFGERYPSIKKYTTDPIRIADKGDILFSVRAPVGEVNIVKEKCCIGRGNASIKMKNGNQEYLYYLLKANKNNIKNYTTGTVFESISGIELRNYPIRVETCYNSQKRIANILSSFDNKIELLREQNKTLENIAQTIFKQWFIHFNFPDSNGKPYKDNGGKMVDSELGMIPEGWEFGKLGDIVECLDSKRIPLSKKERGKRPGPYPYYGATGIMDYIDDYLFEGLHLLLAEDGSVQNEHGNPILQLPNGQFWVSNHAHVLNGRESFSTEYIYFLLRKAVITNLITGAVQPKINQTNLLNFKVVIPSDLTLQRFKKIAKRFVTKIKYNEAYIKSLTKIKLSLSKKLF